MHTEMLVLRGATVDVFWQAVGRGTGIQKKLGPDPREAPGSLRTPARGRSCL